MDKKHNTKSNGVFIKHIPCDHCGSSDAGSYIVMVLPIVLAAILLLPIVIILIIMQKLRL